jgi:YVTN family beta-propeller protein
MPPARLARPAVLLLLLALTGCGGGGQEQADPTDSGSTSVSSPAAPLSEVAAKVDVGGQPCGVVGAAGAVWVSDAQQGRVLRIDPVAAKVTATVDVDASPCEMTFAEGSIWVVTQSGTLDRVDPKTAKVVARIPVGATSYEAVSAFGSIWVTNRSDRTVTQVDPATNKVTKTLVVPEVQPGGIVAVGSQLWVGNDSSGETHVIRLDPVSGEAVRVEAGGGRPAFVTATEDSVWTANQNDGSVSRIDVASAKVTSTVKTGISPVNLDVLPAAHEVWVPDDRKDTVTRIDGTSGKIVETIPVGSGPAVVTAVDGDIWVTNFGDGTVWRIHPSS